MSDSPELKPVTIRSWPKMIFLWPTGVMSLCMGLAMWWAPDWKEAWGATFLIVFGLNLMVLTFEFPRATSLTVAVCVALVGLLMILANQRWGIVAPLKHWITELNISASKDFYLLLFALYVILAFAMFVVTRFDYWQLSANELIHHHGILGDVERFSTAGLKLNKEIADIFEYVLAGAGRVIMLVPGTPRPIILENVLQISKIERDSDRLLNARVVRIETGPSAKPPSDAGSGHQTIDETEGA